MTSCIFCKILAKEIPSKIVHEDESCIGLLDINPQAPVHLLVIPRKHFSSVQEAEESDEPMLGHLYRVAAKLAEEYHISHGYRMVVNTGREAGQSVFHFHLHVLGGRPFRWPPG